MKKVDKLGGIMNAVIENIKSRRSTRNFTEQSVEQNKLDAIIEAGLWAPSAVNKQSWHFTVIQNRDFMNRINKATKEASSKSDIENVRNIASNDKLDIFYGAPSVIIVSSTKDAMLPIMDISAASQNMLLAAESLELGTCWIGLVSMLFNLMPEHEIIKEFNLPEGVKPSHAIVVGYKGHNGNAPERREGTVQYL